MPRDYIESMRRQRRERDAAPIHFVYVLLDDDRPFYVGHTRQEQQLNQHILEARKRIGLHPKNETIRRILAEGRKPGWRKIAEGLSKAEALLIEAQASLPQSRPATIEELQARVAELEEELAAARARIAELEAPG
jgi:hypothetical protein